MPINNKPLSHLKTANAAGMETSIRQLLANGKCKAALDAAKDFHKADATAASEALLIEAYAARIHALFEQNFTLEAKSLLELVRQRYPSAKGAMDEVASVAALRSGSPDELLQPLNDPGISPERRAGIELAVRQRVWDLATLAKCPVLPAEHPIRIAAAALDIAFQAVTSGPVTDAQLALPEVSRRSPLAPWKILIQAIACFHRNEDEKCREFLAAIDPEAAPSRLVRAMLGMLGAQTAEALTPAEAALSARFAQGSAALKKTLEELDEDFVDEEDESRVFKAVRAAMQEARKTAPDVLEDLRRRIYVRSFVAHMRMERLTAAMDGTPRRCAELFRMLARGLELCGEEDEYPSAAGAWEEFRLEALKESWFPAGGKEEATVYLHMAEVVLKTPPPVLKEAQRVLRANRRGLLPDDPAPDLYYLYPDQIFERACALDPHSDAFSKWQRSAAAESAGRGEAVAKDWVKALPHDIEPVLYLMEQAERRNAFPTALGYLASAERIDGIHPVVRAARLRLLAHNVLSHLQKKKPHLAAEKLAQMAALPQAQQGDRPAFLAALRCAVALERRDTALEAEARAGMESILGGGPAGSLLLSNVQNEAKVRTETLPPVKTLTRETRASLPLTVARIALLIRDFRVARFTIPEDYVAELKLQLRLSGKASTISLLGTVHLEALADLGVRAQQNELAYLAAGAGLEREESAAPRFLLLRARSLPDWLSSARKEICATAAAELGRLHRDLTTVEQAVELARDPFDPKPPSLTPDQAREVLRREIAAVKYPAAGAPGPHYRDLLPEEPCDCPDCRRRRGESRGFFPDNFIEGPEDEYPGEVPDGREVLDEKEMRRLFDERVPPGMPREMVEMMYTVMKSAYEHGLSAEEVLEGIPDLGGGNAGRKKGGKKGRRK